ncbi:MAG: hypothetical protein ACU836_03280 [Gammaproteobacteria bacterium]
MSAARYHFDDRDGFIIENYNDQPPFASFLPGIAGVRGRPAWVFYVNRGQGIASFGVRNKDGAFLEFFPADKAYQLTPSRGFRTFLKIGDGAGATRHEPFRRGAGVSVRQRMLVTPHEIGIEEVNPALGVSIRTDLFTLPEAPVSGLVRRVEITNLAAEAQRLDIVDGLPQVQPYAMNQWILKFMSRTAEAFMRVEGAAVHRPFYRLRVWPTDSPQVERVEAGNFFIGLLDGELNPAIVDPECVFAAAGDFATAERFFSTPDLDLENQVLANQTPAAMQTLAFKLAAGESRVFYGVYGHAASPEIFDRFVSEARSDAYLEGKRICNRELIDSIRRRAFTSTAKPLFDQHAQQCYLDNGLRGGFPTAVPGGQMLYLFGRKHGDLERDYNDFLLQDAPYSEGNGDFRDVLQNRRVDIFFEPALGDRNIRYFFNLIQPDGYNPCSLRNWRFAVDSVQSLSRYFSAVPGLEALLSREFKYAELWESLNSATGRADELIGEILALAQTVEHAEFDRGYWSDHWTYLVDLLIAYQAIFPDRLSDLFLDNNYTFFDPTHFVAPRAAKYHITANGLRQYGAVQFSEQKKTLIEGRSCRRYQVRWQHGTGAIVYTSLLGKILTLVANKLATLDPAGIGIEMEADRPGWCDALNGLPGILGSAVNETIELLRLVDFTLVVLAGRDGVVALPAELAEFIDGLDALIARAELSAMQFWRESGELKETYRERVFMGFDGEQRELAWATVRDFLGKASTYSKAAIAKAKTPTGIVTYFAYEAKNYRRLEDGTVAGLEFERMPLPLFLEGFVHALRIADTSEARRLYDAARKSDLFDGKLGMYRLNVPLGEQALDLGRIGVFNDGWLENGSIFLHMHYKFVLEMLRAGLADEFYANIEQLLVAFRNPEQYKRNPAENSSFLVSSGFSVDPRQHGRGCVARLSGSTVEFLHLWTHLFLGPSPFSVQQGVLRFQPAPVLHGSLFSDRVQMLKPFGREESLPDASAACAIFGSTLLVYLNPQRNNTYGEGGVSPCRYHLRRRNGDTQTVSSAYLEGENADALRRGEYRRVDVELG